jgi:hypothetical protein
MTWLHLIDWATAAASIGFKVIGFPSQLRRNLTQGRGTTTVFACAMCIPYAMWVVHGVANHDMTEIVSQGLGVLVSASLLARPRRTRAT